MLNLRTTDARTTGAAAQQVQRHQRPPRPVRRQPLVPEADRRQLAGHQRGLQLRRHRRRLLPERRHLARRATAAGPTPSPSSSASSSTPCPAPAPTPSSPRPAGNRCLPGNASGVAPWSYQGISPNYPPTPPPRSHPSPVASARSTPSACSTPAPATVTTGTAWSAAGSSPSPAGHQRAPGHPAVGGERLAQRHGRRLLRERLRHGLPVRPHRPADLLEPQLPGQPDRAERRHGPHRHARPGVPLHQPAGRPGRRHQRLLRLQPHRQRDGRPRRRRAGPRRRHSPRHHLARPGQGEGGGQHVDGW